MSCTVIIEKLLKIFLQYMKLLKFGYKLPQVHFSVL